MCVWGGGEGGTAVRTREGGLGIWWPERAPALPKPSALQAAYTPKPNVFIRVVAEKPLQFGSACNEVLPILNNDTGLEMPAKQPGDTGTQDPRNTKEFVPTHPCHQVS